MKRLLALAAVVFAMSACEARLEMEVKPDGSGKLGFSFVVEDTFLAALGALGGASADPFAEMKEELEKGPVPFKVEEFRDEKIKGRGIRATVPFKTVDEMKSLIGELNESGESSPFGEGGFENFTLERRGSGWHFSATAPAPDLGELGIPSAGFGPGAEDITKIFKFSLRVTLPGKSADTTATDTEKSGASTVFVWVPDLKNPKPLQMVATTSGGGAVSEFPVIPVAAAGGGLALAAIIAAVIASKRRQTAVEALAAQAIAPPPMEGPGGPPPSGPPGE